MLSLLLLYNALMPYPMPYYAQYYAQYSPKNYDYHYFINCKIDD